MNIYVANLASNVTEEDLKEMFGTFGQIFSAKIIKDYETGQSKGFGFVEMSQSSGQKAIEELNGTEFNGNNIAVSEAFERRNNRDNRDSFNRNNNRRGYH